MNFRKGRNICKFRTYHYHTVRINHYKNTWQCYNINLQLYIYIAIYSVYQQLYILVHGILIKNVA